MVFIVFETENIILNNNFIYIVNVMLLIMLHVVNQKIMQK